MTFPRAGADIPFITEAQMREVDRAMEEDFGVSLLQMMENAGRNLAELARQRFFGGDASGVRVVVLAGPGGNGGGGLAGGRHLSNAGADVSVVLAAPRDRFGGAAATQLATLERSGAAVDETGVARLPGADLVIDAIFGYSMRGDPRPPAAGLISAANAQDAPVLSNDIPSGIEATSGRVGSPSVMAAATLTIALPKTGLEVPGAQERAGELYLGDISVPPPLYTEFLPDAPAAWGPLFSRGHILRLR